MTDQINEQLQSQLKRYLAPVDLSEMSDAHLEKMLEGDENIVPLKSPSKLRYLISPNWIPAAVFVVFGICAFFFRPGSSGPTTPTDQAGSSDSPSTANFAPIRPVFPKPMFTGTPVKAALPNLEKPGKPRLEFSAPEGTSLISIGAKVTSSDSLPIIGELSFVTDGDKEGGEGSFVELSFGRQWVQIDLGEEKEIWGILVWHFHKQALAYKDVVVQISNDADFANKVTTVFNNDHDDSLKLGKGSDPAYIETNHGRILETEGIKGRYIRLYSNGNTENDSNHYTEVEVWGK